MLHKLTVLMVLRLEHIVASKLGRKCKRSDDDDDDDDNDDFGGHTGAEASGGAWCAVAAATTSSNWAGVPHCKSLADSCRAVRTHLAPVHRSAIKRPQSSCTEGCTSMPSMPCAPRAI